MKGILLLFALTVQPIVNEDFLEPSIQNEVDHAIARASSVTNAAPAGGGVRATNSVGRVVGRDIFGTNGLSRTAIAIRLVSEQKGDGRWMRGTNDVTSAVLEILRSL